MADPVEEVRKLNAKELELVRKHMGIARLEAKKVLQRAGRFHTYEELESMAYMGLVKAAHRWEAYCEQNGYDSNATEYFLAFAQRRCAGEILDTIRAMSPVPRSTLDRAKIIREAGYDNGKSLEEVMATTGLSRAVILETMAGLGSPTVTIDDGMEEVLSYEDVEASAFASMVRVEMVKVIRTLPPSHQAILALKYHGGYEMREIARAMHITESRASVAHTEALLEIHAFIAAALKDSA